MREAIPELDEQLAQGDTARATGWLKNNVQKHGGLYEPREVIEKASGRLPVPQPLITYLKTKFSDIYKLQL